MQLKRKILSHFLLAIYLFVVGSHAVQHTHTLEVIESISHQHESSPTVHHEHFFHIGIFHFFGHIMETILHQDDLEADSPILAHNNQNTLVKKVIQPTGSACFYDNINHTTVFPVDAESLSDPPYSFYLIPRFRQPNTPLRAPPALV